MGTEAKLQIELHLTIMADTIEGPVAKPMKNRAELGSLIEANDGRVIAKSKA